MYEIKLKSQKITTVLQTRFFQWLQLNISQNVVLRTIVLAQDCSEMQDQEIFKAVQNLNEDQSQQFWNHLQSIIIPEKTVEYLQQYFKLGYQVVMYCECLNQNDRIYIKNVIREQSQMTRKELLELIMGKQFKNRNIYGEEIKQYFNGQYILYYRQQINNNTNVSSLDMQGNDATIKSQLQGLSKQDFYTKLYQLGLVKKLVDKTIVKALQNKQFRKQIN
ncbi:Hypothetical_protein [Hexamita inflata]|uniref:Hypothetical_protein n=1 Tax=Hexamita inflata TaxID=28002 RepID=A0AA86N810_9EUKA|nr:Hypothetical protein HINF_LOCUS2257 [Hexamita inflata]